MRSPHPFAATAIGLAVFLDKEAGFALSERLSRNFGVVREAHAGEDIFFDLICRRTPHFPPMAGLRLSSRGRTAQRTTSDTSGSWSAAACSMAAPTVT